MDRIKFVVAQSQLKNEKAENYMMVKQLPDMTYDAESLKHYIQNQASVKVSDVDAVTDEIREAAVSHLRSNERFEIPGLGTLWLSLKLNGTKCVTNPKQIRAQDVIIRKIEFTPLRDFSDAVTAAGLGYSRVRCADMHKFDEAEITAQVKAYGEKNAFITTDIFMRQFHVCDTRARRFLNKLSHGEHPLLFVHKQGNSNLYYYAS